MVVPANFKVLIGNWRRGFTIRVLAQDILIHYELDQRRAGINTADYLSLITLSDSVKPNYSSQVDKQGGREGKALPGMTKEGVLAALGYPAPHRTSSLDEISWIYWTNRFKTIAVNFADKRLVREVVC